MPNNTSQHRAVRWGRHTHRGSHQQSAAGADFGGNLSNGATGAATVNLRNLGSQRTLVLVNNRRLMPGDPTQNGAASPDLNQIHGALIAQRHGKQRPPNRVARIRCDESPRPGLRALGILQIVERASRRNARRTLRTIDL